MANMQAGAVVQQLVVARLVAAVRMPMEKWCALALVGSDPASEPTENTAAYITVTGGEDAPI